jgi:DedD protein
MIYPRVFKGLAVVVPCLLGACALLDNTAPTKQGPTTGLIATPPAYYSTARAKYLGTKYKENLDRLVEHIVRNPRTVNLQFANNISSVGGIGFFTHSATATPDERYLEVVLATPETFETRGEYSEKVQRIISRYGLDLLGVLSGDSDLYQEKELSGYGLNLAWRTLLTEPAGSRVAVERAILYFPKQRVRNFLRQEIKQNDLLASAVIFAVEDDGPLNLVSYRPQEPRHDARPAIREDNLAAPTVAANPNGPLPSVIGEETREVESNAELLKKDPPPSKEPVIAAPAPKETKGVVGPPIALAHEQAPVPPVMTSAAIEPVNKLVPAAPAREPLAVSRALKAAPENARVIEPKNDAARSERSIDKPQEQQRAPIEVPKPAATAAVGESAPKPVAVPAPRNIPQPAIVEPVREAKAADVTLAPPAIAPKAEVPRLTEVKPAPALTGQPSVARVGAPSRPSENIKPLAAQTPAKIGAPPIPSNPVPAPAITPPVERSKEKSAGEQIASLPNKPVEAAPPKPTVARPAPKALEGFIIQLAFNDKDKAQRWAETMEKRGYAVSVTEAGTEGALRVRLGNFAVRDDAERQLRTIKQEGLNGIILNMPQAYRPDARSSIP